MKFVKKGNEQTKNMNARMITALLALLGFGTACSGVKEAAKTSDAGSSDSVEIHRPIRLMYGVPVREFQARPLADSVQGAERRQSDADQSADTPLQKE